MLKRLFALCIVCITPLFASVNDLQLISSSETWSDPSGENLIIRNSMEAMESEQAVRSMIDGILASLSRQSQLQKIETLEFTTFQEFPTFHIKGISFSNNKRHNCEIFVVFADNRTETIQSYAPVGLPIPEAKNFIHMDGNPSELTQEAFTSMQPRLDEALSRPITTLKKTQTQGLPKRSKLGNQQLDSSAQKIVIIPTCGIPLNLLDSLEKQLEEFHQVDVLITTCMGINHQWVIPTTGQYNTDKLI